MWHQRFCHKIVNVPGMKMAHKTKFHIDVHIQRFFKAATICYKFITLRIRMCKLLQKHIYSISRKVGIDFGKQGKKTIKGTRQVHPPLHLTGQCSSVGRCRHPSKFHAIVELQFCSAGEHKSLNTMLFTGKCQYI